MNKVDRWLLPDGIEEMLPDEARNVEALRRNLVDLFQRWGYDYVIAPLVEFTDSLLTGSGSEIELLTFKITDQLSGKTMGIRADITPQAARMDAHSLMREGVNRLCYAGHVIHTRPKAPLASRTPIQVGVELFGEPGIDADIEVLSVLLETLSAVGVPKQYIDIGHVGIFRALAEAAEFSSEQENALFALLQSKSETDIRNWLEANVADEVSRRCLLALPRLAGSASILSKAAELLDGAPDEVMAALDELGELNDVLHERYPDAQLYFDLGELRGYRYHTGIVFGAFAPGVGAAIANGGRYDHIGEAFGRARAATGFAADLTAISRIVEWPIAEKPAVFAPASGSEQMWIAVRDLRAAGERVVSGLSGQLQPFEHQVCDRILLERDGVVELQSI